MIDKPVNVAFISQKLKEQFESLNSGKKVLISFIFYITLSKYL